MIETYTPKELGERHLEILREGKVLDVWLPHAGEKADTGPLEVPQEATGVSLVVAAGPMSSVSVEGSSDGGATWDRLAARPCMAALVVRYARDPGPKRLTHLRVQANRAGKGAVKVGMVPLWL